jgi:hypothetical protein
MGIPAERLNTKDGVMATKKPAATTAKTAGAPEPVGATADLSGDDICDYCHVRMAPIRQLMLNNVTHNVLACTADPKHTKNVPA